MFNYFIESSTSHLFGFVLDNSPDNTEKEIESFSALQNGWHLGEGFSPSQETIYRAKEIYRAGKRAGVKSRAFPSVYGGVVIAFYGEDKHCAEISIDRNNAITISYEIGYGFDYTEDFFKENATIDDVKLQCKRLLNRKKQNLLELSIRDYLIMTEAGSPAIASKTLPRTEGFPLLTYSALSNITVPQYANI